MIFASNFRGRITKNLVFNKKNWFGIEQVDIGIVNQLNLTPLQRICLLKNLLTSTQISNVCRVPDLKS